jgi:hypothetical protein
MGDRVALYMIKTIRFCFDLGTRFNKDKMREGDWLNRCIFLETVAGVPGMVGGMARHMQSLRTLRHDHGLIHHLLNEAENERTHLFIFLELKNPGRLFKGMVALSQGLFFNFYFLMYLLFPRVSHRMVGYLEEEAVHTYSILLAQLEAGKLPGWTDLPVSKIAREYYELPDDAKMKDLILSVRADESIHRDLNHKISELVHKMRTTPLSGSGDPHEGHVDCEAELNKILEEDYRIKKGAHERHSKIALDL